MYRTFFLFCLVCLGCQSLAIGPEALRSPSSDNPASQPVSAATVHKKDDLNHLALAMVCLDRGEADGACRHLEVYVQAHPRESQAHSFYGEVLCKLNRVDDAKAELEEAIKALHDEPAPEVARLRHCHGRLFELADEAEDHFSARLNRGIGLYWLARERRAVGDPDGEFPVEAILVKAAGELSSAHHFNRSDARPTWYLYQVWRQLGQSQQANRWLRLAQAAADSSHLTPGEQRQLALACQLHLERP